MIQTQSSIFAKVWRFIFTDTRASVIWLVIRLYVGWEWFMAGWQKFGNPNWVGSEAGTAVKGFLMGALKKTSGEHPDVQSWYAWFINHIALPNATLFSYLVTYGEILVGVALIFGLFTVIASFFGAFMNMNYLLAGTVSTNPILLFLAILLLIAHKISGHIGLDYFLRKRLNH